MKKILNVALVALMISFAANAQEDPKEPETEFETKEELCYDFAKDAADDEWYAGHFSSEREYYQAFNEWYNMCMSV